MKRIFNVTVTLTTDVVVEIDDSSFDEAAMTEFRKHFYNFNDLEEHAEHIAQYAVRFDSPGFLEGYGPVKYDGNLRTWESSVNDWLEGGQNPVLDINLKVGREDIETECEEVTV